MYTIRKLSAKNILIDEIIIDESNIHFVYKIAYEILQESMFYEKVEIWHFSNIDKRLTTLIKRAIPPTDSKKKYDLRTGISFTSDL